MFFTYDEVIWLPMTTPGFPPVRVCFLDPGSYIIYYIRWDLVRKIENILSIISRKRFNRGN